MVYLGAILFIFLAYLFGSIPVGYVVARMYGIDVTASGSGRTGGTNVLRAAGPLAAGLTVMGDVFKGLIPVLLARYAFEVGILLMNSGVAIPWLVDLTVALAMPAAVMGHNRSIFLGFKGGVGAGTAIGTVGGAHILSAILAAACALVALAISRFASMLSTAVAVTSVIFLTIFAWLGYFPYMYILGAVLNLIIIVNALRPNYARIRAGTERKVGQKTENITRV